MIYRAVDIWNSPPHLAHYGVKGMKWGVRHDHRSPTSIRERLATYHQRMLHNAEARRVRKNEKAIASGDPRKVAKRFSKMNDDEVKRAMNRLRDRKAVQEIENYYRPQNKGNGNNGQNGGNRDGIIMNGIKNEANNLVRNALGAAVTSVVTGEKFSDSFRKKYGGKTVSEKMESEQQKYADSLKRQSQNASNKLNIIKKNQEIQDTLAKQKQANDLKRARTVYKEPVNKVLNNVGKTPVVNIEAATRKANTGAYQPRFTRHDDMEDSVNFLSHHGVKGMKWGVRHDADRSTSGEHHILKEKVNSSFNQIKQHSKKAYKELRKQGSTVINKSYKVVSSAHKIKTLSKYAIKAGKVASHSTLVMQGATTLTLMMSNPYTSLGALAVVGAVGVGYGAHKVYKDHLAHYGVKGMHWGVRKDSSSNPVYTRNNAGTIKTIKKGQAVYRIATNEAERKSNAPIYVSPTKEDNKAWANLFLNKSYSKKYIALKDIEIADATAAGKIYTETFLHSHRGRTTVREALLENSKAIGYSSPNAKLRKATDSYMEEHRHVYSGIQMHRDKNTGKVNELSYINLMGAPIDNVTAPSSLFFNAGKQTATQKKFIDNMKSKGYSAISDVRGYDVSNNPVIIFDKSDLKLVSSRRIRNFGKDKYKGTKIWQLSKRRQRRKDIESGKYYDQVKHY